MWTAKQVPAQTFYHSICGGSTESAEKIQFANAEPYLQSVSDYIPPNTNSAENVIAKITEPKTVAYCGVSKMTNDERWTWHSHLDTNAIEKLISDLSLSGELKNITPTKSGDSGRIYEIAIETTGGRKTVFGEYKIRTLLGGLLSSLFVMDLKETAQQNIYALDIHGKGYGHGVGLCQMGAIGRAEAGFSFQDILQTYYPGTSLGPIAK